MTKFKIQVEQQCRNLQFLYKKFKNYKIELKLKTIPALDKFLKSQPHVPVWATEDIQKKIVRTWGSSCGGSGDQLLHTSWHWTVWSPDKYVGTVADTGNDQTNIMCHMSCLHTVKLRRVRHMSCLHTVKLRKVRNIMSCLHTVKLRKVRHNDVL